MSVDSSLAAWPWVRCSYVWSPSLDSEYVDVDGGESDDRKDQTCPSQITLEGAGVFGEAAVVGKRSVLLDLLGVQ